MNHQAFLVVCYILGTNYHSGQWSKGYSLLCLAEMRARREHSSWNIGRTCEQLRNHELYPKHCAFRKLVAYYLFRMRKHRTNL